MTDPVLPAKHFALWEQRLEGIRKYVLRARGPVRTAGRQDVLPAVVPFANRMFCQHGCNLMVVLLPPRFAQRDQDDNFCLHA
ncbi:MAG: hypothetical protein DRJ15_16855 [Bacteroidetes bacterium]|nr:MAG: hypothetical protein DRJ15_16855 [Bacteroidota bacterium]